MPPAGGHAHRDGVVFFFQKILANDLVHIAQRGIAFGGDHKPLGAAIQSVADGGGKALFGGGVILALFGEIGGKLIHQIGIARAVRMAQQVRGLIQHRNIGIFIDHPQAGALGGFAHRSGRLFREKFVVDVQFDQIAFLQAIVGFGALAVDFDAFVAEAFIQKAVRKIGGHALHKARKANAVLVGTGSIAFHVGTPFGLV